MKHLKDLPHVVATIDNIDQLDELLENLKVECADFDVHPNTQDHDLHLIIMMRFLMNHVRIQPSLRTPRP